MALQCGCVDTFYKDYSTENRINEASEYTCETTLRRQSKCKQDIYRRYRNSSLSCDCPQACVTTEFSNRRSSADWPTERFAPHFASTMIKASSKRVQQYFNKAVNDSELSAANLQEKLRKNFARLEVYYEALNFHRITESPAYGMTALLSDVGGKPWPLDGVECAHIIRSCPVFWRVYKNHGVRKPIVI